MLVHVTTTTTAKSERRPATASVRFGGGARARAFASVKWTTVVDADKLDTYLFFVRFCVVECVCCCWYMSNNGYDDDDERVLR